MDDLWAGYPAHLKKFQENMLKADARISELRAGSTDDEEDWLKPESLYSRQGSVGVVKIEGSLIKGEANAIYQMFGYQGYDNIKAALVEARAQACGQKGCLCPQVCVDNEAPRCLGKCGKGRVEKVAGAQRRLQVRAVLAAVGVGRA